MKIKLLFLLIFGVVYMSQGQRAFATSVGLSAGYSEDGYGALFNYNYHNARRSYVHVGLFASFSVDKETVGYEIPYNIFNIQPGYYFRIAQTEGFKPVSLYLGGGGILGYEILNNGNNELPNGALINAKSQFLYGGFAGLEVDYAFSDDWSFVAKANEYYHVNSDVGNWYPYFAVGLRYYLY